MVLLETLNFEDISLNAPHTQHLVKTILDKSQKLYGNVEHIYDTLKTLQQLQTSMASAYRSLAAVFNSLFYELGDEQKQQGLAMDHFFDALSNEILNFGDSLQSLIITRLEDHMTIFRDLISESSSLNARCKARDAAYQTYMKISKKASTQELQNAVLDLANSRLECVRATVLHYKNLNQTEYLQLIIPLWVTTTLGHLVQQHAADTERLLTGAESSFLNTVDNALTNALTAETHMVAKFTEHANRVQSNDLQAFSPEPWLLSIDPSNPTTEPDLGSAQPNPSLSSKSGRLLLRTRVNLVWRWIDVFCHTQSGLLMSQKYDEIGASTLVDLRQQKGVYVEIADYDDRRNVFQIVCPAERKTVVLQAESQLDRDEWLLTLTNVIFDVNSRACRLSNAVGDPGVHANNKSNPETTNSSPLPPPPSSNVPSRITPYSQTTTLWDWVADHHPPVLLELPINPELNAVRDAELVQTHQVSSEMPRPPDDHQPVASGSGSSVDQVTVENDAIQDPLDVEFLGAVELPVSIDPKIQSNLDDIFSYVLSTNHSQTTPCRLLITERELWLLTGAPSGGDAASEVVVMDPKRSDVRLRFALSEFHSWLIHPKNRKLACLVVVGSTERSAAAAAAASNAAAFTPTSDGGQMYLTFETDHSYEISERILAAHLARVDALTAESDKPEKDVLLSNISRLSESSVPTS